MSFETDNTGVTSSSDKNGSSVYSASAERNSGVGMASVKFRVRCECLGHGDSVYLVPSSGKWEGKSIPNRGFPLFTTSKQYPWYFTRSIISITLPSSPSSDGIAPGLHYLYRFAIYRSDEFLRYEDASDYSSKNFEPFNKKLKEELHSLSLHSLAEEETYIVSNVLGLTSAPPGIEKIHVTTSPLYASIDELHAKGKIGYLSSSNSSGYLDKKHRRDNSSFSKIRTNSFDNKQRKKVGFMPEQPSVPPTGCRNIRRSVALKSSDGVIVASAFLPVHLNRSEKGEWSASWDYEALLSMQTHLRVTRVGYVKWRGWHGNYGLGASPEGGVPTEERHLVENCLKSFNCVPVWCVPNKFGEMYDGFCKGVLWSILHNVTTVYSAESEGKGSEGVGELQMKLEKDNQEDDDDEDALFKEYSMDDVAFPIHGDGGREASLWSAYTDINRQFADVIIQNFNEGDIIWLHGFHLMILPSLLTRRIPMAKIGLFLHTPFPSSEIFRMLWCREDLLRGMLNADQVGFHVYEYARHFVTSCRRLLGLNSTMIPDGCGGHNLAIEVNGRHVTVTSIHAGIETDVCKTILSQPTTIEKAASIRNQFKDKIIFCAIDRLESLKGIPLKMLGLERFLLRCPKYIGKVVLIQVGISAYERHDDYFKTKNDLVSMAANVNKVWPGTIHFQEFSESSFRLENRIALLRAADILLVTPIRAGLNLIPLEFTCAHLDALTPEGQRDGRPRGLCILSEFSSCTRVMRGALHVNPWKISEIANAFYQAVSMSEEERLKRVACASEFVTRVTTQRWALAVMLDLKAVQKDTLSTSSYSGAGLGLGYRLVAGMAAGFNALDASKVAKNFKNSRSRLILLDYGGTILRNDQQDSVSRFAFVRKLRAPSVPSDSVLAILKKLCSDPRNTVFVVSGKEKHSLTSTLGNIPNLGLAAEHGMFISWPSSKVDKENNRNWQTLVPEQDRTWRDIAITIMEVYTSRTHGSYIEETEMKVLWQYRDADPEFGFLQAKELEDHLSHVLYDFSVDVLHGGVEDGGYIEVRPKGVNKGVVAIHIIKNISKFQEHRIDFALVIGDDHCDEPMLSVMRVIGRRASETGWKVGDGVLSPLPSTVALVDVSSCDPFIHPNLQIYTCTVGKKPSAAKNYLNEVEDVHELLETMNRIVERSKTWSSMADFRSLNLSDNMDVMRLSRNHSLIQNDPISAPKISLNLTQFLNHTVEDEEEEEDIFF